MSDFIKLLTVGSGRGVPGGGSFSDFGCVSSIFIGFIESGSLRRCTVPSYVVTSKNLLSLDNSILQGNCK